MEENGKSLELINLTMENNNNEYSSLPVLRPSKKLNGIVSQIETDKSRQFQQNLNYGGTRGKSANCKNNERCKKLPVKKFESRESLMTHMLQLEEYQGLYNIFLVVIINMTLYKFISELLEHGSLDLGFIHILSMFGKLGIVIPLLIGMHFCAGVPFYFTFKMWADHRPSFHSLESVWDLCFSIGLGLFIYAFYYIPFQINLIDRLPPASASIIVLEQLRLTMKLYAFIRENIPRVVRSCEQQSFFVDRDNNNVRAISHMQNSLAKINEEEELANGEEKLELEKVQNFNGCPTYDKFLYFLYAPTLIYRDSYPRTKEIRWQFVVTNAVELLGCIYFYNLTQNLCGFVQIKNFGLAGHTVPLSELVRMIFFQMIPGGLSMLLGFFLLLHNTQNIGAELLQFGDRMFYLDWWNSDSFGAYYRKWNLPVHDFLYAYIYKEAKEARLDRIGKPLPAILVFLLSSIFHEYVFIFVLQFFYPILLLFFGGFGMMLAFVPNRGSRSKGNLFIWWSLITGMGLIHSFYCLEYYARVNGCPPASQNPTLDFILPRTWSCGAISLS